MASAAAPKQKLFPSPVPLSPPPNWHTPDHPPYSEMIQAAIRSLAEEGGSTLEAIDVYIKANYHDLPWGHCNLYPHYFKKLLAVGEVRYVGSGRFVIASAVPPILQARRGDVRKEGKGSPKGKELVPLVPVEEAFAVDDPILALLQPELRVPKCKEVAPLDVEEGNSQEPLAIRCGPAEAAEECDLQMLVPVQCDSAVVAAESQMPLEIQRGSTVMAPEFDLQTSAKIKCDCLLSGEGLAGSSVGSLLPKKRGRGRPRKIKSESDIVPVLTTPEGKSVLDGTSVQSTPGSSVGGDRVLMRRGRGRPRGSGRGRGRPPKRETEAEDATVDIDAGVAPQESSRGSSLSMGPGRGRGRPPKKKTEEEDVIVDVEAAVAPRESSRGLSLSKGGGRGRGRGRPPKKKTEEEDVIADVEAAVAPQESSRGLSLSTDAEDVDAAVTSPESGQCSMLPKGRGRGRGRPPKKNIMAEDVDGTVALEPGLPPLGISTHNRRGRPPKSKDGAEN